MFLSCLAGLRLDGRCNRAKMQEALFDLKYRIGANSMQVLYRIETNAEGGACLAPNDGLCTMAYE